LVLFTVILGIYPSIILDGLNYNVTTLLFSFYDYTTNEGPEFDGIKFIPINNLK